jgi:hypothetical protein
MLGPFPFLQKLNMLSEQIGADADFWINMPFLLSLFAFWLP